MGSKQKQVLITVSLKCSQVGWLKAEDQTILTLHDKVVTHNVRISVTHDNRSTWQLHIRQVKESDRGCYMCQINTSVMKKQIGCIDVHGKYYFPIYIQFIERTLYCRYLPFTKHNSFVCERNFANFLNLKVSHIMGTEIYSWLGRA